MSTRTGEVTVVVPARNAAATIARAVCSVSSRRVKEIVLVDHASVDETVERARRASRTPIRVVRAEPQSRLGGVRQIGLEAVLTPFAIWLDADDEFLPGRVERLAAALEQGAAIAADAAEVVSASGLVTPSPIPAFLEKTPAPVRLFERNYLPAPGPIALRVDAVRAVGYDPTLHGPEDTDLLLRALDRDLPFALIGTPGYRVHAAPTSISRRRVNQRLMYGRLLHKHDRGRVEALYRGAGIDRLITWWGLVSFAVFRAEYAGALALLDRLAARTCPDAVLEPEGPCRRIERWRVAFQRGTLRGILGDVQGALRWLEEAVRVDPAPEASNNLGVVLRLRGEEGSARRAFETALQQWSDYADARENLGDPGSLAFTSHPLRQGSYRSDYEPRRLPDVEKPAEAAQGFAA